MWKMKTAIPICINQGADGLVRISEMPNNWYLPENSSLTAKNRFVYSDTASIDIFRLNSVNGDKYTPYRITDRTDPKDTGIKLERDGWFTAIHIVIPTKVWVDRELSKKGSIINTYDVVYFTDGSEIYTCIKGKVERTTLSALLEEERENTTVFRTEKDGVFIDYLLEQQKNLYTELFKTRMYNGGCGLDACEANRIVAFINLIKHYVRFGQLAEAERVIEKFNHFKTIKTSQKDHSLTKGCGCR